MKINMKYAGIAIIVLASLLLTSCMQETIGPVSKTTTKLQINVSNLQSGSNTPLADALLNRNHLSAKNLKIMGVNSDTLNIDEVKLVILDMSKYNDWDAFTQNWSSTGQYNLMDTAIFNKMYREGKDYFDIYRTVFKSYTGTEYSYVGDYGYSLNNGSAEATFYLNPGLNYYFYVFRSSAKDTTLYDGEGHLVVAENVENTIQVGKPNVTGSYSGTWSNSKGDTTGTMTLDIYQAANDSVKGILVMKGFSCYDTLYAGGKVSGTDYVSLYIASNGYSGYLSLYPEGTSVSGNWSIYPYCRSFYYGNVSMKRISTTPNLGKVQ